MDNRTMILLVRRLLPGYNLHERTGIPSSVAIPNQNAARQIMSDIVKTNMFLDFVLLLIDFSDQGRGIAGRKISIPYLRQILNGIYQMGYIFDVSNKIFVENPNERKTRNWGTLKTGQEYTLAFLRVDIVGNTKMVRKHNAAELEKVYLSMRDILVNSVEKRNGRVWHWDGDGGLAAFIFGNMNESAVLSGMELLHELFLYNNLECPIEDGLNVRIAVHSGPFEYTSNNEIMQNSDTVKRVAELEHKHTSVNCLTISEPVKMMLETLTSKQFREFKTTNKRSYFEYRVRLGCNE
ncbi:MAG: hypothetical protein PQJ61_06865 [Spirochaetales bacterium]|uniref:Guanylate cyclase domain-containing protein n=1 Tax=Candidatus Thalassospirochaeta sargassi TaxID=3119039 RepID=A0AAJ1IBZ8_9SPIO|nr:hypothetical protein [Spirochaetales bacterium]